MQKINLFIHKPNFELKIGKDEEYLSEYLNMTTSKLEEKKINIENDISLYQCNHWIDYGNFRLSLASLFNFLPIIIIIIVPSGALLALAALFGVVFAIDIYFWAVLGFPNEWSLFFDSIREEFKINTGLVGIDRLLNKFFGFIILSELGRAATCLLAFISYSFFNTRLDVYLANMTHRGLLIRHRRSIVRALDILKYSKI